MKTLRITVRYEGRVQGVGFRYTAASLARELGLAGYVRNEFDGSVELVAEGEEDLLMELMDSIRRSHLGRYITNTVVRRSAATGEFKGYFSVKH
ncbi:MAG: acylphosphatase [Verrucomicrobiota bacterium]|jgi:acylphosphatase|nr:acylphosphatase [Verrucomicrobiota bacterium]MDK2962966.1 acylphosphatase [Verrucomicrobiota bacterium]